MLLSRMYFTSNDFQSPALSAVCVVFTCEAHFCGDAVDGEDVSGSVVTGLHEELLRRRVSVVTFNNTETFPRHVCMTLKQPALVHKPSFIIIYLNMHTYYSICVLHCKFKFKQMQICC